ncbi:MAG TPA: tRNA (N(6)-L-threonylcarbamoyladenosine(37)-C(2))-methylthiotransferase MtaB [Anaerolineaceae bacterium]|nr:tRNA (N(6)-L-threonylcarbamoyladenosine(37)-C(2))-methylthiotransferase MtaB [Anaerolineaceae bacterium]
MNVFFDTIGCRLNQSEIEIMAAQFRKAGHIVVSCSEDAELVIVNTCTVTKAAASDSRQKIRQAAHKGDAQIFATGCWATLEPEAALALPGVQKVVANQDKENLVSDYLKITPLVFDLEPLAREPIPGEHSRTRAFIKVQDGCDNFCTFCITKVARGKGVSRSLNEILMDIKQAQVGGVQEVVLSGVHLGSWGKDFDTPSQLRDLIEVILKQTEVPRLRLSSLEPWDLGKSFFSLWQDARMCPHLHLPLQSGSEAILRKMARKTTPEKYMRIVEEARSVVPDVAITTDMIVGFPGETDELFEESMAFVRKVNFAGGHIFPFSARPGTAAAKFPDQIQKQIKKKRSAAMRAVFAEMTHQYQSRFIGETVEVLWENGEELPEGGWLMKGLTGNYLRIAINSEYNLSNTISKIKISTFSNNNMAGIIQENS